MSYHIVKNIVIDKKEKKVFITGCDNNVYPRTPYRWHCTYFDKWTKEEDYTQLDVEIFKAYESGSFQTKGRSNKYTRALKILDRMKEYEKFDWRKWEIDKPDLRKELPLEFETVLRKALSKKLPKEKYLLCKEHDGTKYYGRLSRNSVKWGSKEKATKFDYEDEIERIKPYFYNTSNWQAELIK